MIRFDGVTRNAEGYALAGVEVYVCTQPASTGSIPPSPLATLGSDSSGTPLANPAVSDGNGNFFFYAAAGIYTLVYFDPFNRIPTTVFPDQNVVSPGGGTVTSVALTVPAEYSVAGSPITSSGTLAISKVNQNANVVYAGPSSGGAAAPGFRSLVSADFPAGVGSVTSVQLAISATSPLSGNISGTNPITTNGTFTVNISIANQAANLVIAGPASGGTGPVSARALVAADMCGVVAVGFSATPTFDASLFAFPTFKMTLTGSVASSTVSNATSGQRITFVITQDGTGGRPFAWPANFKGASTIGPDANSVSVQSFVNDGTNWRADGPGLVTAS